MNQIITLCQPSWIAQTIFACTCVTEVSCQQWCTRTSRERTELWTRKSLHGNEVREAAFRRWLSPGRAYSII